MPIAGVTTCRTTPATWADYVDEREQRSCSATSWATTRGRTTSTRATSPTTTRRCPRPTPTRAASSTRSSTACWGATTRRSTAPSAPLVQLTPARRSAATLAQQDAWAANAPRARSPRGCRTACCTSRTATAAAMDVPLTGTTVGRRSTAARSPAGRRIAGRRRAGLAPDDPANTAAPRSRARRRSASTLTADNGHVDRHAADRLRLPVAALRRRRRNCANIPGATGATYRVAAADDGATLRVVVLGRQLGLLGQPGRLAARPARPSREATGNPAVGGARPRASAAAAPRAPAPLEADQGQDEPAALRGLAQAQAPRARGSTARASRGSSTSAATVRLTFQRQAGAQAPRWVRRRHDQALGEDGHRRRALPRALRPQGCSAARATGSWPWPSSGTRRRTAST